MASTTNHLSITVASGDALDVREFSVNERMSGLFDVTLVAVSENPDIDLEAVAGLPARFQISGQVMGAGARFWSGVCNELQQLAVEDSGLSTYHLSIVPTLWFTTQRRNYRMFQQMSELDIVLKLLGEWGVEPVQKLTGTYKKRKYRVQYAESDYTFICRMLEDAGIAFYFQQGDSDTQLVLSDAPQDNPLRAPKISFRDTPTHADREHVTSVRVGRKVRPGRYTMRDHDYRKDPRYKLLAEAEVRADGVEKQLERYHYTPGAFLFGVDKGDDTPNADDKGKSRTDEGEAAVLAQKRLDAKRANASTITFETNALDLAPGVVMSMLDHPRTDLGANRRILVVESMMSGTASGEWRHTVEARSAEAAYRPPLATPKPKVIGVESATVVGPAGEEIHCDEFGRVRVHFHWDRESQLDDSSSCWIHVSQPWGGAGYGGVNLPRVGQEVIVDFLGGDPDRPVIIGRVYTNLQKVPFKLPENKTQSGLKSNSTTGTGGYNELMFEDAAGRELVRMQAEKDMHKLVKNDEQSVVGRDRMRHTKRDEDITIGKNLTKNVVGNERELTGGNRSIVVGVNRSAQIGGVDSVMVGSTHSVMVSPPGEGGGDSTANVMSHDKIVFSTPSGASIVLEGDKITLRARAIDMNATALLTAGSGGESYFVGAQKATLGSATQTVINGSSSTDITGGTVNITGNPMVFVNPSGALFAGRVTDLAPDQITKGAATVLIGGPTFPYEVRRLPDGRIQVGPNMFIHPDARRPNFQAETLAALGIMSTTPSGSTLLNNLATSGKNVDFKYFDELNGKTQWRGSGATDGSGTDATILWNPDYQSGNPHGPPAPSDTTLFHEMGHADHVTHGTVDLTETHDDWDNVEERNTINDTYPSENDYFEDRGYPWYRPDHRPDSMVEDRPPVTPP